ncbi:hypothetical protein STCU_10316 [Strigomonas culicis]|uniref:Uncharacterized protein n=1 Tax=Strigomonas culicis TaxID=28005 RepID=S9V4V2_9TRYP|nr:hypothetical protein STCU_10316 [Strigomonas culicis]|eukprot:EPY17920.1 hypothetical protein STCU_10316 [Strigomonas culicis]
MTQTSDSLLSVTRNSAGVWATTSLGGVLLFHADVARARTNTTELEVGLVRPVVRASTMLSRAGHPLLCLADGPLVHQGTGAKYRREWPCFWMAGVDSTNTLILFSSRTQLSPFGKVPLPPMRGGRAESPEPPAQAKRQKEELQVMDLATGVAIIFADSGVLQFAVAHNRNVISIVTWRAPVLSSPEDAAA